jgi:hypothetical protein
MAASRLNGGNGFAQGTGKAPLRGLVETPCGHGHDSALAGEPMRDGGTDAPAGAGHKGDPALERPSPLLIS